MSEFKQSFSEIENDKKDILENLSIDAFLGLKEETHSELITAYNVVNGLKEAFEKGNEKEYTILRDKLIEVRDKTFPTISIEKLSEIAIQYRTFILRGFNLSFGKHFSELNDLGSFVTALKTNTTAGEVDYKFIKPIPIKKNGLDLSKADRMRRRHRSAALKTSDTIAVTLPNSFIYTRIRRPTKLEQVNLINRIEKELKYFGERWAVSGLSLERGGIAKILVEFFIELITYHSVEDIVTKEELITIILYNDIDAIAMALLEAGSPKGVYYNLTCLANKCSYSSVRKYEPSELHLVLQHSYSEEHWAFLSKLPVLGRKCTIEEIKGYQNKYFRKGEEIDTTVKLYREDDKEKAYGEINVGIPTLVEYFETFEFMAQVYNDAIQKYTMDYASDAVKLYRKRSELIGATRMGVYLHWIKNYITYPEIGSEEDESIIDDRSGEEQRQFEEGLLYIFNDDDEAYENVVAKINAVIPFMSHSITGIYESQCPGCKEVAGEAKDNEGGEISAHPMAKQSAFTPIDPVTNFFDHTRMKIATLGAEQQKEEANIF